MFVATQNSRRLAVTTAVNHTPQLIDLAHSYALSLNGCFVSRDDTTTDQIFQQTGVDRILILRRDRFLLLDSSGTEYQFHPNLAIVRAANYLSIGSDHFLEALELQPGEQVLDCTIGFGSEAILASLVVGPLGEVVGLESVPELAIVTREGMQRFKLQQKKLEHVMNRVVVLNFDYRDYLCLSPTRSVDVVYFDPFFDQALERSESAIAPLASFGNRAPLDIGSVSEARRVARRIVVIKHKKWHKLPDTIRDQTDRVVSGRRSTVAYTIMKGFGN